jgi:SET domain-containing protein
MPLLENQLEVKRSNIPGSGKGLFTTKAIEKGAIIVEYTGKRTTWAEVDHKEGKNGYIYYVNRNCVIDASENRNSLARYANDAEGLKIIKGITNNCSFVKQGEKVFLKALRNIRPGEELMAAYGKEYWETVKFNLGLRK